METHTNVRARLTAICLLIGGRAFPYTHFFVATFSFLALLIASNIISLGDFHTLFYLIPCFFTLLALYPHNELCDKEFDPPNKNMITRGEVLEDDALLSSVLFTLLAIISAVVLYKSLLTIGVFCSYVVFTLAYSGLKLRFKTTIAGPFVASYILWVGPSLILLTIFSFWNNITISLLLGIFLVFSAHELHHQIDDYISDKKLNARTLAVRFGIKKSLFISGILTIVGFLLILYSMYFSIQYFYVVVFAFFISLFVVLQSIMASTRKVLVINNIPTKLILTSYGCIILGFSSLITLLILMISVAEIPPVILYSIIPSERADSKFE